MGPIGTRTTAFCLHVTRAQAKFLWVKRRLLAELIAPEWLVVSGLKLPHIHFSLPRGEKPLRLSAFLTIDNLNSEFCKKALEKVGNPNVLINLISRRVRQINSGSGAISRPLVADTANLGAADIALLEIIEEKIGWDMPELSDVEKPSATKKRKRH